MRRWARLVPVLACALLLSTCAGFGVGLTELPADAGWQPLPVGNWIIDDAIRPRAVVICPPQTCAAPAVVAVFQVAGEEADRLEHLIATTPEKLVERPARSSRPSGRRTAAAHPGSVTEIEQLSDAGVLADGARGARILIRSKGPDGRMVAGVVLARRQGSRLDIAIAVTTAPDAALRHARSGLRSL